MHDAQVTDGGAWIRWLELPVDPRPPRVFLHGLGCASGPAFTEAVLRPALAGHRSLLLDLLGFGLSDRPDDFGYTLEEHADTVAAAMEAAGTGPADVIAHSMGGAVAIVLAARHPDLVARLVLVDSNLDPRVPAPGPGSQGIATYSEQDFLEEGWQATRDLAGARWWAMVRQASRTALFRSAVGLVRGTDPTMRELLLKLAIPRTFLRPADDDPLPGASELADAGVEIIDIPRCGHDIMLDNPDGFAAATARALAR